MPIRLPLTRPCSATSFNTQLKTRLVDLTREPPARLRQPRVIGNLLPVLQAQKIAQRHRIRTAPGDAALAGDPLEITDHVHAEVAPRRHRRRTHLRRVIGLARRLDKPVKTARDQHLLKPVVKHVSWRPRHLRPGRDQIALPIALPPHRHSATSDSPSASYGINEIRLRQRAASPFIFQASARPAAINRGQCVDFGERGTLRPCGGRITQSTASFSRSNCHTGSHWPGWARRPTSLHRDDRPYCCGARNVAWHASQNLISLNTVSVFCLSPLFTASSSWAICVATCLSAATNLSCSFQISG